MKTTLVLSAILLGFTACDFSSFGLNHKIIPESKNHAHQVSEANPAWLDKELKNRVSPAQTAVSKTAENLVMAVHYSSPSVKGREIWGELVPYNEVWRTGADEATMLELSNDVIIANKRLTAGRYSIFTIPDKDEWTIIINKVFDQWGAFQYDKHKKQDVIRFKTPIRKSNFREDLNFEFKEVDSSQTNLVFSWENIAVEFPIQSTGNTN